MKEGEQGPLFPKLRVRIKDNNTSLHGKFRRFLFPFFSKFPDQNRASYVLYIFQCGTRSEPGLPVVCRVFGGMKASSSVEETSSETSSAPRKRRGKYCAAFDRNNSAYDVKGTRTSYHFFELPKDAQQGIGRCSLIKRRHGQDDFVVSTATVLCHEHFRAEEISKKPSGRWNLRTGL